MTDLPQLPPGTPGLPAGPALAQAILDLLPVQRRLAAPAAAPASGEAVQRQATPEPSGRAPAPPPRCWSDTLYQLLRRLLLVAPAAAGASSACAANLAAAGSGALAAGGRSDSLQRFSSAGGGRRAVVPGMCCCVPLQRAPCGWHGKQPPAHKPPPCPPDVQRVWISLARPAAAPATCSSAAAAGTGHGCLWTRCRRRRRTWKGRREPAHELDSTVPSWAVATAGAADAMRRTPTPPLTPCSSLPSPAVNAALPPHPCNLPPSTCYFALLPAFHVLLCCALAYATSALARATTHHPHPRPPTLHHHSAAPIMRQRVRR